MSTNESSSIPNSEFSMISSSNPNIGSSFLKEVSNLFDYQFKNIDQDSLSLASKQELLDLDEKYLPILKNLLFSPNLDSLITGNPEEKVLSELLLIAKDIASNPNYNTTEISEIVTQILHTVNVAKHMRLTELNPQVLLDNSSIINNSSVEDIGVTSEQIKNACEILSSFFSS